MLITGCLIADGGWIKREGVTCFNLYRPPVLKRGNASKALLWLRHVLKVFNKIDARHIVSWLAHRVQQPHEKINHALVLGGAQDIGKDTLLEPMKEAVGAWSFHEVSPKQISGRFNGFLKSVILRVNEARDLGDVDRFKFYDNMRRTRLRRLMCYGSMKSMCANIQYSMFAASSSRPITRVMEFFCPPMIGGIT